MSAYLQSALLTARNADASLRAALPDYQSIESHMVRDTQLVSTCLLQAQNVSRDAGSQTANLTISACAGHASVPLTFTIQLV